MAHLGVTQKVSCIDLTNIWWLIGLSARKKNSNIIPDPAEVIHHQGWFYTLLSTMRLRSKHTRISWNHAIYLCYCWKGTLVTTNFCWIKLCLPYLFLKIIYFYHLEQTGWLLKKKTAYLWIGLVSLDYVTEAVIRYSVIGHAMCGGGWRAIRQPTTLPRPDVLHGHDPTTVQLAQRKCLSLQCYPPRTNTELGVWLDN